MMSRFETLNMTHCMSMKRKHTKPKTTSKLMLMKLKQHGKHHGKKHMRMMKKLLKTGLSFDKAHKIAAMKDHS